MAWNIRFAGTIMGTVSDETKEGIVGGLCQAAEQGASMKFGIRSTDGTPIVEGFWTPGAPIVFERVEDE